jgi:hypothetical protein
LADRVASRKNAGKCHHERSLKRVIEMNGICILGSGEYHRAARSAKVIEDFHAALCGVPFPDFPGFCY